MPSNSRPPGSFSCSSPYPGNNRLLYVAAIGSPPYTTDRVPQTLVFYGNRNASRILFCWDASRCDVDKAPTIAQLLLQLTRFWLERTCELHPPCDAINVDAAILLSSISHHVYPQGENVYVGDPQLHIAAVASRAPIIVVSTPQYIDIRDRQSLRRTTEHNAVGTSGLPAESVILNFGGSLNAQRHHSFPLDLKLSRFY